MKVLRQLKAALTPTHVQYGWDTRYNAFVWTTRYNAFVFEPCNQRIQNQICMHFTLVCSSAESTVISVSLPLCHVHVCTERYSFHWWIPFRWNIHVHVSYNISGVKFVYMSITGGSICYVHLYYGSFTTHSCLPHNTCSCLPHTHSNHILRLM